MARSVTLNGAVPSKDGFQRCNMSVSLGSPSLCERLIASARLDLQKREVLTRGGE
jgi:hypothetical protein